MDSFALVWGGEAEPWHNENGIFSHARWCGVGEGRTFAYGERVIFSHARWCGVGEGRTFAYRERVIFLHARTFV